MMENTIYISVILPLKLDWEPCYSLPESIDSSVINIGDRVKVRFANKIYTGVVSAVGITPETSPSRILSTLSVETDMPRISLQEIELWRQVADYYLCSVGEVYKAAYPYGKLALEEERVASLKKAAERKNRLMQAMREKVAKITSRLERKRELINKSKAGSRAMERYIEEEEKIRQELLAAEGVLEAAEALKESSFTPLTEPLIQLSPAQEKAR